MARALAIAAHPDDELFGGGYLAKLAAEGTELFLLITTRGEGGEVGEPPLTTKDRLGEVREQEQRRAASALGARDVFFLDFIDPHMEIDGVASKIETDAITFQKAIEPHLKDLRPDILITHGSNGEYGHPQHIYTHQRVFAAIRALTPWRPRELLTWCANDGTNTDNPHTNQDDIADFSLDVTPWFDRKLAAAEYHVTQHAMFLRNSGMKDLADTLDKREAYRRWKV
jgi:LmbE family N-acetylglucosaminyl deacetylase